MDTKATENMTTEVDEVKEALVELGQAVAKVSEDAQKASFEVSTEGRSPNELRVIECVEKIRLMNAIMGNTPVLGRNPSVALTLLSNQERIFQEERNETFEALRHNCYKEVLDGLVDMLVVAQGYEFLNSPISTDDIEQHGLGENLAGYMGASVHSIGVGALSGVIFEQIANSLQIARIEAQKLFIEKLGVSGDKFVEAHIKALELVCDNNLTKFTQDETTAEKWLKKFKKSELTKEGIHIRSSQVNGETWYALIDANGKGRKNKDYQSVDLQPVVDELLSEVNPDLLVDQEVATEGFLKATKGGVA